MKKDIISITKWSFCAGLLLFASCTKMDYLYKEYVIERTFIGKPDSIWVQPGDQRVKIGMLTPKDAEAKNWVIRWNNNVDSLIVPIDHSVKSQSIIIENMEERDYIFESFTADGKGLRSLPMELYTTVYGKEFRKKIHERELSHSIIFPDSVALVWKNKFIESLYGVETEFTDKSGKKQKAFSPATSDISVMRDADPTKPMIVRSAYQPHVNAFEHFYTDPENVDVAAVKKNSLTFKSLNYQTADYIDLKFLRVFLQADVPKPVGKDIDLAYTLGGGSRANLFTMNGTGFSVFSQDWQLTIAQTWRVRNVATMKLNRGGAAITLYDDLDETNRSQMVAAYDNSTPAGLNRLSALQVNDVILINSSDRKMYIAMKVMSIPPATGTVGELTVELKVSKL